MIIAIVDCNHGFFEPEIEESNKLNVTLKLPDQHYNIIEQCYDADAILVQRFHVSKVIIDQLPNCKVVTRYGVGLDNIDCDIKNNGIKVVHFPNFCTEEVANHTLASILFMYRKVHDIQHQGSSLSQDWGNPDILKSIQSASETIIGIIGTGRIGKAVATRLLACGFQVIYYDPYVNLDDIVSVDNIESIFQRSDIVTVHVPLTHETYKMIDSRLLGMMKHGASIVNTSRGEIICNHDLLKLLYDRKIYLAFVDVWDPEPPPTKIWECPYLYISHHCAFYSRQSLDYLKRQAIIQTVKTFYDM